MNSIRPFLSLLLVIAVLTPPAAGAPNLDQLRRQAQAYYREGRYPEATRIYERMKTLNPKNAEVLKEAMWGFWNMQQFDLATRTAQEVLKLNPKDKEAENVLSWVPRAANREKIFELREKAVKNYQAGRYQQAVEFYRQLVELDPNNVATLKDWLWALWFAERYDQVKPLANRILKLQPGDTATTDLLNKLPAAIYRKRLAETASAANEARNRADFESAVSSYQELLRMNPADAEAMRSLAWAYYKLQRFTEAKETAMQLMGARPADPAAWNLLGRMQEACDERESAVQSYETSLKLDPKQLDIQSQMGRLHVRLRDLDRGIESLERVRSSGFASPHIYPLLAKALFYKEQYARSAEVWAEAYQKDPSHFEYRFFEAQARYYAGQPAGMKLMTELSSTYQDDMATTFLINEARARGDSVTAEEMMEKGLKEITAGNIDKAMALAGLQLTMGKLDKGLLLLQRIEKAWPEYTKPIVIQGSIYRQRQLYAEASKAYRRALAINPNYDIARLGLAESEFDAGHWDSALQEIRRAREFDPTNPYLLLRETRYRYETGEPDAAHAELVDWVEKNAKDPVLTVLLYHGLTPIETDPRLAALGNYRIRIFSDHIRALKQAGYAPVTVAEVAEWRAGTRALPEKPVLITFDDGRLDSLRYADPVLEKYDYKATMFSLLANAEGARPIAFASWPQLLGYQANGRWEIQSHGDQAHTPIPVDDKHDGLFIVNRRWDAERKTYETPEQWRARVLNDYETSRKTIGDRTGQNPVGYAFAEGEYGQHHTNYREAAVENLALVRQVYKVGFVEDNYGFNTITRDPLRLARIEPNQNWTGDELVTYLRDKNARVFIFQELLHQAIWRARYREAYTWLARLKDADVSERVLWGEEARIRYAGGDLASGYDLASRVLSYSPEHFGQLIEHNIVKEGPAWNPGVLYSKDDQNRESYAFENRFQLRRWGNTNPYLAHRWARYFETGFSDVTDNSLGAGADVKLSLFHELSAEVRGHNLSAPTDNAVSANASLDSSWTDIFKTRLEAAHDIHYTARALSANIRQTTGAAMLEWENKQHWALRLRGRYFALSDENRRQQSQVQLTRTLDYRDRLRFVYRFTYDNMNDVSPLYYSPQTMLLHEIGPELNLTLGRRFALAASYRGGIGTERNVDHQFVQEVIAQLRWMVTERFWFMPSYWFQQSPTYRQRTFGVFLRYRFGTLENMGVPIAKDMEEPLL